MSQFNIKNEFSIEEKYNQGLLPQRNQRDNFYSETSCRSNLDNFSLSSENRRIIRKTEDFSFERIPLDHFVFDIQLQKKLFHWIKGLGWDFPVSSAKNVFTNHIFNYLYVWKNPSGDVVAYSICYFSDTISHIAYVFYDPQYAHGNLPIRLVLQVVADSHDLGLKYCYLGRFSRESGFYKRNMPGFEYYSDGQWLGFNNSSETL
ncbi:MAG TPA: hypothetical protein VF828_02380 [Patescibacteria group bacterium]